MKVLLCVLLAAMPMLAAATDVPEIQLAIQNHRYQPEELKVPAGVKFKLIVTNKDSTPEEFESVDLKREKIVMPNGKITVFIGPLDAGTYKFFGDFHQDTAQGRMIAE